MKLLALDTTTESIVIALKNDDSTDYFVSEKGSKKHNSTLLTHIDEILRKNGLTINDIDVFGIAVGPGSFTGIRVGVATVNAFNLVLGKKIVEITTLEMPNFTVPSMTLLDCKHGNYYCGVYTENGAEYFALNEAEIAEYTYPKIYMEGVYPTELLNKCVEKYYKNEFCEQAKPFYLKKSSAERETGIYAD